MFVNVLLHVLCAIANFTWQTVWGARTEGITPDRSYSNVSLRLVANLGVRKRVLDVL